MGNGPVYRRARWRRIPRSHRRLQPGGGGTLSAPARLHSQRRRTRVQRCWMRISSAALARVSVCPPCSCPTVHCEGVERIVDLELAHQAPVKGKPDSARPPADGLFAAETQLTRRLATGAGWVDPRHSWQMPLSGATHQQPACPAHAPHFRPPQVAPPSARTVPHTAALSPPRGALGVLPRPV